VSLSPLFPIRCTTPNGVRVVGVALPTQQRIVVSAMLRAGSRYESEANNGLSHFLEHMLFRGVPSHPTAHALALGFEAHGGTLAAATSTDMGALGVAMPPESFEATLRLLADVYTRPVFSDVDVEKGIVREEILESLDEHGNVTEPEDVVRQVCFGDHPLSLPILGTADRLEGFSHADLVQHHARHYSARNTVVAVAGPIDESVVRRVAEAFSDVPDGPEIHTLAPAPQAGLRHRFVKKLGNQTELCVAFRAPSATSADEPALDLLMRTLDDGMSTRLYAEICDKRGLCYEVRADYEGYTDSGLVEIHAECVHENAPEVLSTILGVIGDLRDHGPTAAEVDKAKRRHGWEARRLSDSAEDVAEHFAVGELTSYETDLARRVALVQGLTTGDVRNVAERWWTPSNMSIVALGTQPKKARARLEAIIAKAG
jgi:predicted Zn-dependent peptidase